MRWAPFLIVLLFLPTGTAQTASWNDPADDMVLRYAVTGGDAGSGADVPNPAGWFPQYELVRAGIYEETDDQLIFEVVPLSSDKQGTEPESSPYVYYNLYFTFHGEERRIQVQKYGNSGISIGNSFSFSPWAYLQHKEGEQWTYDRFLATEEHPDGEGWLISATKWWFRDLQNVPVRAGDVLENMYIETESWEYDSGVLFCPDTTSQSTLPFGYGCGFDPRDNIGSAGSPMGSYEVTVNPEGLGDILMEIERPVRASNGLATTYVYTIRVLNFGETADQLTLQAGNVPAGWDVYLPRRLDLEPGESVDLRVAVGVPFGHKHGEEETILIRAVSNIDPTTDLGVNLVVWWPEIAQPSGHHPNLYFHGQEYYDWMNTAQIDPSSTTDALRPNKFSSLVSRDNEDVKVLYQDLYWSMFLNPGMFTGLDFDITKPITASISGVVGSSMPDAEVTANLLLYFEEDSPILVGTQTQNMAFVGDETFTIDLEMPVNAEADRIPYTQFMTMGFYLSIHGESDPPTYAGSLGGELLGFFSGEPSPTDALYSGSSSLQLPLLDFHDDVDQGLLDSYTRLKLSAPEEVAKPVNAGRTVAFEFELTNAGAKADTVAWSIEGPLAEWAKVVPGRTDVGAGKNATVAVRVDVPADESADQAADLLLVGQSVSDPAAQVFGRFVAYVVDDEEIPDEADQFKQIQSEANKNEAKGSPSPVIVPLVALAVAGLIRRRS